MIEVIYQESSVRPSSAGGISVRGYLSVFESTAQQTKLTKAVGSACLVLRDDSLEQQQCRRFGLSRSVFIPPRSVSVGLSGSSSVLRRPGTSVRQQRMEV